MKKLLVSAIMVGSLGFGQMAFAAEDSEKVEVDPGVTPDSFFYSFDQFWEDIQLYFTRDSEKEANLLYRFAQERLAEANVLSDEDKEKLVSKTIEDYIKLVDDFGETASDAIVDEDTNKNVKDELVEKLDNVTEMDTNVEEDLDSKQQDQLADQKESVKILAKVVQGIDEEVVQSLREKKMGYGQIAQVVLLAKITGKTVDEVADIYGEHKGFGQVVKQLGLTPAEVKGKMGKSAKLVETKTNEDTEEQEVGDTTSSKDTQIEVDETGDIKTQITEKVENSTNAISTSVENVKAKNEPIKNNKKSEKVSKSTEKKAEIATKKVESNKKQETKVEKSKESDNLGSKNKEKTEQVKEKVQEVKQENQNNSNKGKKEESGKNNNEKKNQEHHK